jgi:N-acetylmuramoyl-L-alanine amidase
MGARTLSRAAVRAEPAVMQFGKKKKSTEELLEEKGYWPGEWVCADCGYIYEPSADRPFEELRPRWKCPQCAGPRRRFVKKAGGVTAQINDSLKLGNTLLQEIGRVGKLHKPQVEQASFAVLKAPDIPSVLVEAAFISNPEEEAKLNTEAYQEQLAKALMRGIEGYFGRNPPLARSRSI